MLNDIGLEYGHGFNQLFVKRKEYRKTILLVAKVTDDFLCSPTLETVNGFMAHLSYKFEVGKVVVEKEFQFNGCEIRQDILCNIRMTMRRYLERSMSIRISRNRNKERDEPATKE